ncbi:DNA/RNA polymerase [Tilletiaria anomala UBC 951]|uniref:DNA polymerase kappa n=1 Tax=Tilletiaria anomala (strain ATCC 24038 / CBS 436.72 / UBC 951) TaxID=1037660 RepID=A0A066W452_TILAU|nr:DNA/RNA polymerase [Tilletiaria anomala UBC 951]KDN48511.1 DNA/RNA polymerase [Tilletiaria anomala UBC 951]
MNFLRDRDDDFNFGRSPSAGIAARNGSPLTSPSKIESSSKAAGKKRASEAMDDAAEASLRRRIAGPSSAKAGLAFDQYEINRIIYETTKGGKFFDHEKKKDAQVTEQVRRMTEKRDTRLRGIREGSMAWKNIEKEIESAVARLESTRDLSHAILHCDMDAFYASVELKRDPALKGKEYAVGGEGILVTASYEARKFGVRSGMATFVARALCPHLIVVKNNMGDYVAASRQIMDVLLNYDENLAQASLDEAYMDVTGYVEQHETTVEQVVEQIRGEVQDKTGLTVSIGIAPNTMVAKICSDFNKPNGQYRVQPDRNTVITFMRDLPVRKVPGIGRVSEKILESLGIRTCGDIWTHRVMLYLTFDGKIDWLLQAHLGLGSHVVQPAQRHERKSVGRETTFMPTANETEMLTHLRKCCDQVEKDLERLDFDGRTVTLVAKHATYQRFSRAFTYHTVRHYKSADDLYSIAKQQFDAEQKRSGGLKLRLIGVRLTNLRDLQLLQDGGPLKKMLMSAGRSIAASKSDIGWNLNAGGTSDEVNLGKGDVASTEEGEERQIRLALEASLREVQVGNVQFSQGEATHCDKGLVSRDGLDEKSELRQDAHQLFQDCPVCQRRISFAPATIEEVMNQRLNQHIDACLSGFNDLSPSDSAARKGDQSHIEFYFKS